MSHVLRWLLAEDADRRQRLRIRRLFMAVASYAMWYLLAVAGWRAGLLDVSGLQIAFAGLGVLAGQAAFFMLIRSGISRRWRDPSMTAAQLIVGLAWALFLIAVTREIRGLMLSVYMVTLLFGIFLLDRRQFLYAGLGAYAGYAALIVFEHAQGTAFFSTGYYLVSLIVLGGVLLWTIAFGVYVSNLRHRLQARNEELERVAAQMRELADRDDLTGLHNRRVIMDALKQLKARADRTGETFSVCIIDLDKFKDVNDAHGHLAGDRVLAEFSAAMSEELRGMDIVAREHPAFGRYGGEEFILLLPGTHGDGARRCAERLRNCQELRRAAHAGGVPGCTLSAGVAEYRAGEDIESLLRRADHALYAAKREGRNRVALAD